MDRSKQQPKSKAEASLMEANDAGRQETVQAVGGGALGGFALGAVLSSALGPASLAVTIFGSALGGLLGGAAGLGVKAFTDEPKRPRK